MKNPFKKLVPSSAPPVFSYADSQRVMQRVKPLYEELERRGVAPLIHGMGAAWDAKANQPYVFIHLPMDYSQDMRSLPQSHDGIEIRYGKTPMAVGN